MILIEKITIDDNDFSFYNGIDFNIIMNHSKDGSDGFIFCFIDSWAKEVKSWERESKIDSVLTNEIFKKFSSKQIENNYIAIYQLNGLELIDLFEIVKEKVIKNNFPEHPWIPIGGKNTGKIKVSN